MGLGSILGRQDLLFNVYLVISGTKKCPLALWGLTIFNCHIYVKLTFEITIKTETSGVNVYNYSTGNGHKVALPCIQSHLVAISGTTFLNY